VGIDLTGLRALNFANRVYKFNFRKTATLGRHEIHFWKQDFDTVRKGFGFEYDESLAVGSFCEPLLRKLGAEDITSIDASGFEGASMVHDFNQPIPETLHNQFDAFLDFGSIEHIFNVAQVIDNVVKLVKPGGQVLIATNANGFPAHGLFQYSPEFFYSVFSERNGFRNTSVFLVNTLRPKLWHLIEQPAHLKRRNQIPFESQMTLVVLSTKTSCVDQLRVVQSDYDDTWARFETGNWTRWNAEHISGWKRLLHQVVNPYTYRIASQLALTFEVRQQYRGDRALVDPDNVDPAKFKTEVACSVGSSSYGAAVEAH
jgi:SAM-dependent methyltransferase